MVPCSWRIVKIHCLLNSEEVDVDISDVVTAESVLYRDLTLSYCMQQLLVSAQHACATLPCLILTCSTGFNTDHCVFYWPLCVIYFDR